MFVAAEGCYKDGDMTAEVGTQEPTVPSTPQSDWCHPVPHAAMEWRINCCPVLHECGLAQEAGTAEMQARKCQAGTPERAFTQRWKHAVRSPVFYVIPPLKSNSVQDAVLLQHPWRVNHSGCANEGITEGLENAHGSVPSWTPST